MGADDPSWRVASGLQYSRPANPDVAHQWQTKVAEIDVTAQIQQIISFVKKITGSSQFRITTYGTDS
jgi:hypothetical protein